jgi:hypothetical protein
MSEVEETETERRCRSRRAGSSRTGIVEGKVHNRHCVGKLVFLFGGCVSLGLIELGRVEDENEKKTKTMRPSRYMPMVDECST